MKLRHPFVTLAYFASSAASFAWGADPVQLPNGMSITPVAAPHSVQLLLNPHNARRPDFTLGQAVTTALSPDGTQLLALTSGYNRGPGALCDFPEYGLVYDLTSYPPRQVQALPIANAFCGLAWNPSGQEFYVSGGVDDSIHVFARPDRRESRLGYYHAAAVTLGHAHANGLLSSASAPANTAAPKPITGGIAVNRSGTVAVVANFYNDSISLIDLKTRAKSAELDLRPGISDQAKAGVPGGEYPYWVAVRGDEQAFVSSPRDREIVVVSIAVSAAWSQKRLGKEDYGEEDKLDTTRFNRVLWTGLMGDRPYPARRSGQNLRENRQALLNGGRVP